MQKNITLQVLPHEASSDQLLLEIIASNTSTSMDAITGFHILKKSMDARSRTIRINLTLLVFINEPFVERTSMNFIFNDVSKATREIIIIGAGPAGIFAALQLLEMGIRPVILERGKDVRARRRDLAVLNREGIVNPESNYCFGEGGAGTYSDGKLYTRSSKRGNIDRILNLFVHFGADTKILYEAHPHIGTNKLPHIISAMRELIVAKGGRFLFNKKVTDFIVAEGSIKKVITADGDDFSADAVILATGHSARDIFELLAKKQIQIESKPFALGVRVEHPQHLIDSAQYKLQPSTSEHASKIERPDFLPPASYSLVQQVNGRGVFSFCMCPGGIIAAAATAPGEVVVNGWSPSKRNNPFANSGMVVQVEKSDAFSFLKKQNAFKNIQPEDPLLTMYFQQIIEHACYDAGGGKMVAPAQRMVDFSSKKISQNFPDCSYQPGLHAAKLSDILPDFIYDSLASGFKMFGQKMKGYFTNEAVVVATESRTSSPVRIPRNPDTLAHSQIKNLYPCGEGAGYAGGIVSAAMDGEKIALQCAAFIS